MKRIWVHKLEYWELVNWEYRASVYSGPIIIANQACSKCCRELLCDQSINVYCILSISKNHISLLVNYGTDDLHKRSIFRDRDEQKFNKFITALIKNEKDLG